MIMARPTTEYNLYPRLDSTGKPFGRDCLIGQMEHLRSKHRVLTIGDFDWDMESSNVLLAMDSMDSTRPIILLINSCGGVLDTAFILYDTIKLIKAPVITVGKLVASAGVLTLIAGTKRYLFPHSKVMLHLIQGQVEGDTKEQKIAQKEFDKSQKEMIKIYQDCGVKKTEKQILKDIDRELWLNAKEAIDYGLADAILTPETYTELFGVERFVFAEGKNG